MWCPQLMLARHTSDQCMLKMTALDQFLIERSIAAGPQPQCGTANQYYQKYYQPLAITLHHTTAPIVHA
jgi:hypothetical protein